MSDEDFDAMLAVLLTIRSWSGERPPTTIEIAYGLAMGRRAALLAVEALKRRGLVVEEPWWPDERLVLRARRGSA